MKAQGACSIQMKKLYPPVAVWILRQPKSCSFLPLSREWVPKVWRLWHPPCKGLWNVAACQEAPLRCLVTVKKRLSPNIKAPHLDTPPHSLCLRLALDSAAYFELCAFQAQRFTLTCGNIRIDRALPLMLPHEMAPGRPTIRLCTALVSKAACDHRIN